jgi:Domain of unknown function (DUF5666)
MLSACSRLVAVLGSVALTAACSQGSAQLSPSGPSTVLFDTGAGAAIGGWTASSQASSTAHGISLSAARGGKKTVSGVGTVANLRGSCNPSGDQEHLSFNIQGVKVVTDENTEFFINAEEAPIEGGCGNLRNGTKVRVVAAETQNADFTYTAESITITDQPGGPPPTPVEGEGVVAALKGECPALTMVVHGYPVMTTSSTVFEGGDCEAIVPGTRVHVVGVLGGNSVVADSVEILAPL